MLKAAGAGLLAALHLAGTPAIYTVMPQPPKTQEALIIETLSEVAKNLAALQGEIRDSQRAADERERARSDRELSQAERMSDIARITERLARAIEDKNTADAKRDSERWGR